MAQRSKQQRAAWRAWLNWPAKKMAWLAKTTATATSKNNHAHGSMAQQRSALAPARVTRQSTITRV